MTRALPRRLLPRARALPLIVATALFMENLDSTVISTSLPRIAIDLDTSPIHLKLALTSYLLALAVFIPASGWASDRFGARSVFRLAIVIFALGSISCGASDSLGWLVCSRVLQGIGGSMMVPVGRLIVLRTTEKSDLVNALSWLTVPALLGPVLGPPVGGFITTYFDWRWIFWINIPIAILGICLVTAFVPRIETEAVRRFDFIGFLEIGPGLSAFITGVTLAGLGIAPVWMILALILGGLALVVMYVRHAARVEAPLVDLRLLSIPSFRIAAGAGTLFRVGGGALPFLLPLMLQLGFGISPFRSGLLTFATGAGAITMKFMAQRLLGRFGFRRVLVRNALVGAALLALPALFSAGTPWLVMVVALFVGGISRSLQFTSVGALSYAEVPPERLSSATSFSSVLQQLSVTMGISVAALGLQTAQRWTGGTITAATFPPVFLLVALVAGSSVFWFARLSPDAGSGLIARKTAPAHPPVAEGTPPPAAKAPAE